MAYSVYRVVYKRMEITACDFLSVFPSRSSKQLFPGLPRVDRLTFVSSFSGHVMFSGLKLVQLICSYIYVFSKS
jgi:hypothetical protein